MRGMPGAVLCAALMLVAGGAQAAKLIAVLPLDVTNTQGKLNKAAQASIEEMLRDVATNTLRPLGWTILSGENTIQVLRDNGVKPEECGERACHLSNARELKAEAFISGSIQFVEGEFIASIRLIETKTGSLLTSERVRAKSVLSLSDEFEKQSGRFFERTGLLKGRASSEGQGATSVPTTESTGTSRATAAVGSLTVTAKAGTAVQLELVGPNGKSLVSKAPYENRAAAPGRWRITAKASGYEEETREINVPMDDVALAKFELKQLGGLIVLGEPRDAAVHVSGSDGFSKEGRLPWEATGLRSGTYQIKVSRSGYAEMKETASVSPGKTAKVSISLRKLDTDEPKTGPIRSTDLARAIRGRMGAAKACYERVLKIDPTLQGKVVLRFTITPLGRISEVSVRDDDMNSRQFNDCLLRLVRTWSFSFRPAEEVTVNFPFVFKPGK